MVEFLKKHLVILIVSTLALWLALYFGYSKSLDAKVKPMNEDLVAEMESMNIEQILVDVSELNNEDSVKYIDLQDILDYDLKSGDIVKVKIIYDNETKTNKEAYISVNTDENEIMVTYEDGDYGQIKLPQNVEMSRSEFVKKVTETVENSKEDK